MKDLTACAVLLRYLCDTAAAPLQRCLVEREDALAGDVSLFADVIFLRHIHIVLFDSVRKGKINSLSN